MHLFYRRSDLSPIGVAGDSRVGVAEGKPRLRTSQINGDRTRVRHGRAVQKL